MLINLNLSRTTYNQFAERTSKKELGRDKRSDSGSKHYTCIANSLVLRSKYIRIEKLKGSPPFRSRRPRCRHDNYITILQNKL